MKIHDIDEQSLNQYLENLFSSFMISGENHNAKLVNDFKSKIDPTWEFIDFNDNFTPNRQINGFQIIDGFSFLGGYTSANRAIHEPENLNDGEQTFFFAVYWDTCPRVHVFVKEGRLGKGNSDIFDEDAIVSAIQTEFLKK